MLDTVRDFETPEGIELKLRCAGLVPRALAWLIDTLIRIGIDIVLSVVLLPLGKFGFGMFLIGLFAVEWFYPVVFEMFMDGATPGKRSMGLRVVHDDGTPVGWSASITRNLLRFVDFLPFLYLFGVVSMMFNRESRRLGDIVAGTVVVYAEEQRAAFDLPAAEAEAPLYVLLPDEQQAVVSFAERATQLTPERASELAALTGPLVESADEPAQQLFSHARYVTGQIA